MHEDLLEEVPQSPDRNTQGRLRKHGTVKTWKQCRYCIRDILTVSSDVCPSCNHLRPRAKERRYEQKLGILS